MSRGKNLQEMEVGTTQSKTAVNANASAADPMQTGNASGVSTPGQTGSWEDLGGPTPENYRSDDDSAKLKEPSATLKQVKDVVNKNASAADAMKKMKEEVEDEEVEEVNEEDEFRSALEKQRAKRKAEKDSQKKSLKDRMSAAAERNKLGEEAEEEYDEEYDEEDEAEGEDEFVEEENNLNLNIEEDVNALLEGEDLSEEFKEKAKLIFETAINAKIEEIHESLEKHYEQQLLEEVEAMKEQLVERVDSYLEYVSEEWLNENALVVEQGLKSEMTESFLSGMKDLFEAHYVSIPEDKYDVLESMVEKLDDMETKLNEQIDKNIALNRRLAESVSDVIFSEVTEGLALSQKDKLASLVENVEFDGEEDYREKLVTLRESYFPKNTKSPRDFSETPLEGQNIQEEVSGVMSTYLQSLRRVSNK